MLMMLEANPLFILVPITGMILCFSGMMFMKSRFARRQDKQEKKPEEKPERKLSQEQKVFMLAQQMQGQLKTTDLVIHLGLPLPEASSVLDKLTVQEGSRVQMNVREDGVITYDFLELKPNSQKANIQ